MPGQSMVHRGLRYAGADDLAVRLGDVLAPAIDAGHAVSVAVDGPTREVLEDRLGARTHHVAYVDVDRLRRHDPFQLVARRASAIAATAREGRRSVFVGQNQPSFGLGDAFWLRLEAALQAGCAELPVDIVCPYREDAPALRKVHTEIVGDDGTVRANPEHRSPAEIVAALPGPELPELGDAVVTLPFAASTLAELRRGLQAHLVAAGVPERLEHDLVYAVSEVATNSVEHGGGCGDVSLWVADDVVTCEVADAGVLAEPFPGVRPPSLEQPRGRGLWLARTLCDEVDVVAGPDRTRVRLALLR